MTKLTPLLEQIWTTRELKALSTASSKTRQPVWTFYDISGSGMHLRGTQKTLVWQTGAIGYRNGGKSTSLG
jgi:hypothetical protein